MGIESVLRYKNIFASLIAVLAVLFAANSIYSGYLKDGEKLKGKSKKIEDIKVMAGSLKRMDKQLKGTKAKVFNGDIFDFKRFLERTAESSGITINSFKPHTVKERKNYSKVEIDINITADYTGLTKLVHTIEDDASVTIIKLDRRKNAGRYVILFYVVLK